MIIVTSDEIPGRKIRRVLGLTRGTSVRARHFGRDLLAFLRGMVGGEVHEYTKLLAESREHALDRMVAEARSLGANAIVGTRFITSEVAGAVAELLVYGTAVVIDEE